MNKNNRISEFSLILITQDNHTFLVVLVLLQFCCFSMLSHVVTFSQVSVFFSSFKAIMLLLVQLREAIIFFSCRIIYNFDI